MTTIAEKTSPAAAARESANSGEIVHVRCVDRAAARIYALELSCQLEESDETGSISSSLEVFGTLDGDDVRVHVSVAE